MDRFGVQYRLFAKSQLDAESFAAAIALENTVEIPRDVVPKGYIEDVVLGQVLTVVQETETTFSEDVLKSCKDLLGEEGGLLATRQKRAGRKLTYTVPVRLLANMNKVAMPTGDLFDKRRIKPILLDVPATEISGGSYIVPESHLEKCFPGARRVEIRFVADI